MGSARIMEVQLLTKFKEKQNVICYVIKTGVLTIFGSVT